MFKLRFSASVPVALQLRYTKERKQIVCCCAGKEQIGRIASLYLLNTRSGPEVVVADFDGLNIRTTDCDDNCIPAFGCAKCRSNISNYAQTLDMQKAALTTTFDVGEKVSVIQHPFTENRRGRSLNSLQ